MEIELKQLPIAGQTVNVSVDGGIGITSINVFVDSMLVLQHDCDDPPCHEMVEIPAGTRGSTLKIITTDSVGNSESAEYQISDFDPGESSVITMKG